ncbi:unnamed protein product [Tetraodon nigroviridis]|uniref:(spotted green pufferfish) hypothetical protein n=1 Tax=Tetraodon nigroviridis TaxID=99883 RepID=Q4RIY3_TETNG|nr:unnamed protein product [Tetraodon nigroviridis]
MLPSHGSSGETSSSPYQLQTNTTTFSPKDQVQAPFKGFLLQARDAVTPDSESAIGTFTLVRPDVTQLLTCSNRQGSAVSHTSDVSKTEVLATWNAPAEAPSYVQFFVTVVAQYRMFWVKLPGPIINQPDVTPLPTQPRTTPPLTSPTTPSILPGPFSSEECGRTKSCMLDPPGCEPRDPQCFFLSMTTEEPDKKSVRFELSGPAEGYVAFALSWDTRMADLSSVSWRLADGLMQCQFSRPVAPSSPDTRRFSLEREYFLFLANGDAQQGKIWKHDRQPLISTKKKLITGPPEVLRGSRGPTLLKIHGALMLLAWMLTGSVGTFIASFYKPDWPSKTLLGQKVWFQVSKGMDLSGQSTGSAQGLGLGLGLGLGEGLGLGLGHGGRPGTLKSQQLMNWTPSRGSSSQENFS